MTTREKLLENLRRNQKAKEDLAQLKQFEVESSLKLSKEEELANQRQQEEQIWAEFSLSDGKRGNVLGTISAYHVVLEENDLLKLFGEIDTFEISLLGSSSMPLSKFYRAAIATISTNGAVGSQSQDALDLCLTWLSRAAGCKIHDLVPPGEIFPKAEKYAKNLEQLALPVITQQKQLEETIVFMLSRVLDFINYVNLVSLSIEHTAILLFTLLRISIDRLAENNIQTGVLRIMQKIFNCDETRQRKIVFEFAAIFLHLAEDMITLLFAIELIRDVTCGCIGILPILTSILISKSEHDNLAVEDLSDQPKTAYLIEHLRVLRKILPEVPEIMDTRGSYAIFCSLDFAVCSCMINDLQPDLMERMTRVIKETSQNLKAVKEQRSVNEMLARGIIEARANAIIDRCRVGKRAQLTFQDPSD